jgi:hypothetical protein
MSRRFSINDVELPANLMKDLSTQVLKELNKQDEATFYEFFEGLSIEDVSKALSPLPPFHVPFTERLLGCAMVGQQRLPRFVGYYDIIV